MCLTLPVKIKKLNGIIAELADGRKVNVAIVGKVKAGDWILANADLAVSKISVREAEEIEALLKK